MENNTWKKQETNRDVTNKEENGYYWIYYVGFEIQNESILDV